MKQHRNSYRLCVVTSALSKPKLTAFAYAREIGDWADQGNHDCRLSIEERVAARCRAT